MLNHLFTEKINGKRYKAGGLKRQKDDPRDFKMGGLFGYTPKQSRHIIPTLSVKDQQNMNTCTQESATVQSEVREGILLSEQSLTCLSVASGVITGDGFSTLRQIQNVIQKSGIAENRYLDKPRTSWGEYSSPNNLTKTIQDNAYVHRTKSYWQIIGRSQTLKTLDDGYIIQTGLDWYSGWNMNWGFRAPWIISQANGVKVGGHALVIIGYDLNYFGQKVYILQNSYSSGYGEQGKFYVTMDYFDNYAYQCYAQLDIELDIAGFINAYEGKYVKNSKGGIFIIENGTKRAFENWIIYLSHGGMKGIAEKVDDSLLNAVPTGEPIKIEETAGWGIVHEVSQSDNLALAQQYAKLPLN